MPPLLGDMVVQLLGPHAGVAVVGQAAAGTDALAAAQANGADLLVVADHDGAGDTCVDRIMALPGIAILAITDDGAQGRLVQLRPGAVRLDRPGLAALASQLEARD
jgi:ABC-type hemin transport system substrate-binding protein